MSKKKSSHLSFIIAFLTVNVKIYITSNYDFHSLLNNSSPLEIHCQSKDDDLGYYMISANYNYSWNFHEHFLVVHCSLVIFGGTKKKIYLIFLAKV